ncbi:MAG TPA: sulfite exporter TauE/SafE family protein [Smithellaceae bacterium]|nr:sulfite exporter TauE/SafE family protein [Smithellaceae bacterium]
MTSRRGANHKTGESRMEKHLVSFGIGLAAGLFGGLIGLGGGFIMIPLLVGWLKLDQCRAHGTSLAVLIFTGLSGAATYGWHGNVNWPAAIALAAPAVVTAAAGARLADRLPDWKLKRAFGVFLIFCSALLLLRPCFSAIADHLPAHIMLAALLVVGAFTGFLSGLMGVGGGTIMVPAMILLAGFSQHLAQGTALLVMVPAGLVGAWTHWKLGNVASGLLYGMIPGILVGTFMGGSLAQFIPEDPLRWMFVFVAIYMGVRYVATVKPDVC